MSGPLKNTRHEAFARELAKGKTANEAYKAAGYKQNDGNCIRLKGNKRILERVGEFQGKAAGRAEVTVASLILEAEEARQLAMRLDQPSAAVAAIKEKGVLSGKRVEKRENTGLSSVVEELSEEELEAILEQIRAIEISRGETSNQGIGPTESEGEAKQARRFN